VSLIGWAYACDDRSTNHVGQGGDRPNAGARRLRIGRREGKLVVRSASRVSLGNNCTRVDAFRWSPVHAVAASPGTESGYGTSIRIERPGRKRDLPNPRAQAEGNALDLATVCEMIHPED
jgi:hypothetical protein